MKTQVLVFALLAATAAAVLAYPAQRGADPGDDPGREATALVPKQAPRPKVEVAFVLDTTGSMSGLIEAAKENIWSIARSMASAQPVPEIRLGLVAYRDRGDAYVTRIVDLSPDLDSMYATLMDFRAGGGGDGPESVNQALYDAVHRLSWSAGGDSYRVIFLVGDAPPHMDYANDVPYPETLKVAASRGIVVNTIQAGQQPDTGRIWRAIAGLNQGRYFQVGQDGNAVAVATPFDGELAALSQSLDETRLFYGDAEEQRQMAAKAAATEKLHAQGSLASRARRAEFNASPPGAKNLAGDKDLVADVDAGRVTLEALPEASLPPPMRELKPAERERLVRDTAAKRRALQEKIRSLGEQRQAYIEKELRERKLEEASLDYQIFQAVKAQAADKGLNYEEAPRY